MTTIPVTPVAPVAPVGTESPAPVGPDLAGSDLAVLCAAAAHDLAALGDVAAPLVSVARTAAALGAGRPSAALDDPGFALDLLLALPPGTPDGAALTGRVLAYLRARARNGPAPAGTGVTGGVTLAEAVAEYEAGAFRRVPHNTARTYRTWIRRVSAAYGDRPARSITTGDLADLVATHIEATRRAAKDSASRRRGRPGRCGEITAVTALRHLWRYLGDKGYADPAVAAALTKPSKPRAANRRGYRPDEAALMRHLARSGKSDPLLDECVLLLAERAMLRKEEITSLRLCDVDLDAGLLHVSGKGGEPRTVPMTPGLAAFLRRYVADRRPAGVTPEDFARSTDKLLRRRPTRAHPQGRRSGRRRIETMFTRFHAAAPALFADGMLCLHSYRNAGAKYLEVHHGRAMSRAALGHVSRSSPTDHYIEITEDELREALARYENHLLAHDAPTPPVRGHDGADAS